MAEIVNLRLARKAKARSGAEQAASENRAKFGRTRGDKQRDTVEAARLAKTIEGAKREE